MVTRSHRYATAATRAATVLLGLETGAPASSREYLIRNVDGHLQKAKKPSPRCGRAGAALRRFEVRSANPRPTDHLVCAIVK